ncbi:Transposable element tc3 transposase [Oopsacas minuta]|uniref:Transposable element tc3 transposase n=1 Tax=Oopsacas minuta TaxID=111878 RepID=A0AAV7JWW3_9METZ|nr:Transposable element tc3 transposase [Oopsacas minuta]
MQDRAPAHTANLTQFMCEKNFLKFWMKEERPGNSPDLNPIENLWSILKDSVSQMENVTKLDHLISQAKKAWESIDPKILENLVASMPNRIRSVIECDGDYIN